MTPGRPPGRPTGTRQGERGSLIPLVAGYVALLVALVVVVVDVTAVQLARARLYDVADALALDAADAIAQPALYRDGMGGTVPVTDDTVRQAAQRLLDAQQRPPNVAAWRLADGTGADGAGPDAGSGSGIAAVVTLTGRVEVPIAAGLLDAVGGSVALTVRSRSQASITAPSPTRSPSPTPGPPSTTSSTSSSGPSGPSPGPSSGPSNVPPRPSGPTT